MENTLPISIIQDSFKKPKFIGSAILLVFGLALLDESLFIGTPLMLIGICLPFYNDGIDIDTDNGRFRYFTSWFGVKRGKWLNLEKYKCILVLHRTGTREFIGARGAIASTQKYSQYEVVIADATHQRHIFLTDFETKKEASAFAHEFSKQLNFPIEPFKPKISERTQSRRKRRPRKNEH